MNRSLQARDENETLLDLWISIAKYLDTLSLYMTLFTSKRHLSMLKTRIDTLNIRDLSFQCIRLGYVEQLKLLMNRWIVKFLDRYHDTSYCLEAIKNNQIDMLQFLIEHNYACLSLNKMVIQCLLENNDFDFIAFFEIKMDLSLLVINETKKSYKRQRKLLADYQRVIKEPSYVKRNFKFSQKESLLLSKILK